MLLNASNLTVSFDGKTVIDKVSFTIKEREKLALTGVNGAGKTTLLNLICGELRPESGSVAFASDTTYGYLKQTNVLNSDKAILDEVISSAEGLLRMEAELNDLEASLEHLSGEELNKATKRYTTLRETFKLEGGYSFKSEAKGILKGLGFKEEDLSRRTDTLSGGQKTRVALSKLLLSKPDLAILDEPTNHLDVAGIEWLETFLKNYPKAVLIVSHDRYFLDRVVERVMELEGGTLMSYTGNYTAFAAKKAAIRKAQLKAYMNQQREIKHSEEVIARLKQFNREKSVKRANSRQKSLDKTERLEKPAELNDAMDLRLSPEIESGKDVLMVFSLSKSYPGNPLFEDISFDLRRGEKVALIGDNGTGKTTLLKILTQDLKADSGEFTLGTNVHIGYYDQEHAALDPSNTLFDEISDAYPGLDNTRIRNTLAAFLFTGDDVFRRISDISGGEYGRVLLARLMLSRANFLILDEPTNHLDVMSREILEEAINSYEGTVFFVSHDRYFINRCAQRILELKDKGLTEYKGDFDYYLKKREELKTGIPADAAVKDTPSAGTLDWKAQKARAASMRKRENDLKRCEEEIASLEARLNEIEGLLVSEEVASSPLRLTELSDEQAAINASLEELMEKWEGLQE